MADRRQNRKGGLLDQDNFSNELDKLKQNAENMQLEREKGQPQLEDILEGDDEEEDEPLRKKSINLTAIKEKDDEASLGASGQK